MSLLPRNTPEECHPGFNGCTCSCHTSPGMLHVQPCCYPAPVAAVPAVQPVMVDFSDLDNMPDNPDSLNALAKIDPLTWGQPVMWGTVPTWQDRAKADGNFPLYSGSMPATPYMELEIAELREALAAPVTAQTDVVALNAALVLETERAIRQRDEFLRTGVSTASHGGSHDTCFPAILRQHLGKDDTVAPINPKRLNGEREVLEEVRDNLEAIISIETVEPQIRLLEDAVILAKAALNALIAAPVAPVTEREVPGMRLVGYVYLVPDDFSQSYDVRFWESVPMGTRLFMKEPLPAAPTPPEAVEKGGA